MKDEIKNNLDNPKQLEQLYRNNKTSFKKEFALIYPDIQESSAAQFWKERLDFENKEISWGGKNELLFVLVISFIAGLIAKIPHFTGIEEVYFYPRNMAFVVFPMLTAYFAWKHRLSIKKLLPIGAIILTSAVYINLLPRNDKSDTLVLACIHLPLLLWAVLGFTFTADIKNLARRIDFLRYNGDLIVMTGVILIAGGILSVTTVALFELIHIRIEDFYFSNVAIWGLAAAPIFGTFLVQANPHLVKNVSPIIAKGFTPLVLIMLVIYLGAIIYTGKDPYNDREFLLLFNVLLIGVMAIILFSIAETSKGAGAKVSVLLLLLLSVVTIIVNGIALSAIIFRISEWGVTPNRLAVLGGNVLILTNLIMVTYRLFRSVRHSDELVTVENSIAYFLPVYSLWTVVVVFLFPVMFGFK